MHEIQAYLEEEIGTAVSTSTVCIFLHNHGFSRQKMVRVAIQRNKQLRSKYSEDVSIFSPDMFVFIDKTSSDSRDCLRKLGYSLRGQPATALKIFNGGQHISALAAMSTEGLLECTLVEGGVCGNTSKTFIEKKLSPLLNPFNGTNLQSILIMDNAAIHYTENVCKLLEDLGVLIYIYIYLPPYSQDLNPIEELFCKSQISTES